MIDNLNSFFIKTLQKYFAQDEVGIESTFKCISTWNRSSSELTDNTATIFKYSTIIDTVIFSNCKFSKAVNMQA